MDVRYLGFTLSTKNKKVSIEDLLDRLETLSGTEDNSQKLSRRIFFKKSSDDYHKGMVLTVRDQSKFCKMQDNQGNISISVENLMGNEKLLEFNFFVINKKTGRGLYQEYHHSCSIKSFFKYLHLNFTDLRRKSIDSEIASINNPSFKQKANIRKSHKPALEAGLIVDKSDLFSAIADLHKVSTLEYTLDTIEPHDQFGKPLADICKRKREIVVFDAIAPASIASTLRNNMGSIGIKKGRITGYESKDKKVSYPINERPEYFGTYDFDNIAPMVDNIKSNEFTECKILQELISTCRSKRFRFTFEANEK